MEENQISKFESIKSYEYKNLPLLKLMLEKCLLRFDGEHLLSLERSCAENFSKKALNARNLVKEQIEKMY